MIRKRGVGVTVSLSVLIVGSVPAVLRAAPPSSLEYSTFLGGTPRDEVLAIEVDGDGNTYVAGLAGSGFPTTPGAFDETVGGGGDGFVTKIDPDGNVIFSTVIGGGKGDEVRGMSVDDAGNVFVTGVTRSPGFPTTAGAYDRTHSGRDDIFIAKLAATGDDLLFSTFVGKDKADVPNGISIDDNGAIFSVGFTASENFPTTREAWRRKHAGVWDAFALKLNASGTGLRYSTLFGGSQVDEAKDIEVQDGRAFISGFTASANLPTTSDAFDGTFGGSVDTFVLGLTKSGSKRIFSTYLGAGNTDLPAPFEGVALGPEGEIHIVGTTASAGFPVTDDAYSDDRGGPADAFIASFQPDGTLNYSTFFGGSSFDDGHGIDVDGDGDVVFSGVTVSNDLPQGALGYDATLNGHRDAFVTVLDTSSNTIEFSTYFGGIDDPNIDRQGEWGYGVAIGSDGRLHVGGGTDSTDLPTTPDAFQDVHGGFIDGFLATFSG